MGVTSPGTTTGLADAEAFAARLSDDGVDTLCCLNPTLAELELALRRFCDLARPINGVQAVRVNSVVTGHFLQHGTPVPSALAP